ncbi:hypothetical protein BLNAU_9564 [Blattamonas nauphoetae]|uniref:Protein kinase domain-containing protein n=1 Tax=Blattamonas nauphoetae TaxID=2049346 RepID=A0ABQ9XVK0_9EUKA|nr:hypothetical protein BLNAU_9564 [Blattamonas nauphoetae]
MSLTALIPPEAINQEPYNLRLDIWAAGCVFYEMLTGEHPFETESMQVLHRKIRAGPNFNHPILAPLIRSCPSLGDLLHKMFAQNPADRIDTLGSQLLNHPYFTQSHPRINPNTLQFQWMEFTQLKTGDYTPQHNSVVPLSGVGTRSIDQNGVHLLQVDFIGRQTGDFDPRNHTMERDGGVMTQKIKPVTTTVRVVPDTFQPGQQRNVAQFPNPRPKSTRTAAHQIPTRQSPEPVTEPTSLQQQPAQNRFRRKIAKAEEKVTVACEYCGVAVEIDQMDNHVQKMHKGDVEVGKMLKEAQKEREDLRRQKRELKERREREEKERREREEQMRREYGVMGRRAPEEQMRREFGVMGRRAPEEQMRREYGVMGRRAPEEQMRREYGVMGQREREEQERKEREEKERKDRKKKERREREEKERKEQEEKVRNEREEKERHRHAVITCQFCFASVQRSVFVAHFHQQHITTRYSATQTVCPLCDATLARRDFASHLRSDHPSALLSIAAACPICNNDRKLSQMVSHMCRCFHRPKSKSPSPSALVKCPFCQTEMPFVELLDHIENEEAVLHNFEEDHHPNLRRDWSEMRQRLNDHRGTEAKRRAEQQLSEVPNGQDLVRMSEGGVKSDLKNQQDEPCPFCVHTIRPDTFLSHLVNECRPITKSGTLYRCPLCSVSTLDGPQIRAFTSPNLLLDHLKLIHAAELTRTPRHTDFDQQCFLCRMNGVASNPSHLRSHLEHSHQNFLGWVTFTRGDRCLRILRGHDCFIGAQEDTNSIQIQAGTFYANEFISCQTIHLKGKRETYLVPSSSTANAVMFDMRNTTFSLHSTQLVPAQHAFRLDESSLLLHRTTIVLSSASSPIVSKNSQTVLNSVSIS